MTYIIENVNLLREAQLKKTSLLIENDKIAAIKPSFNRFTYFRMNGDPFIMTPTHVIYHSNIPLEKNFQELKNYFITEFIMKGCTLFLTSIEIPYEYMLQAKIKKMKTCLMNSPIDYTLGIKIKKNLLNPNFIRKCKNEKIPAIFLEILKEEDLQSIPWGWIKEALFPYNSPLIPVISTKNIREKKRMEIAWKKCVEREKIPYIEKELMDRQPISYRNLAKMGIIPLKGNIQQGGEVSYNFYRKSREIRNVDGFQLFQYYENSLQVTVHKGSVIRAGEKVWYRPGFGEYVKINRPSVVY